MPELWPDAPEPGPGFVEAWARDRGCLPVVGIDEAGRGCLAGPVVAAAVVLPDLCEIPGLDDSKRISASGRDRLYDAVRATAIAWSIAECGPDRIDATDILRATFLAMRTAASDVASRLDVPVGIVIVDGSMVVPGLDLPQKAWIKGDHLSLSCAAASILAKVHRDRLMERLDAEHPGYGFARHKGYGTAEHLAALARLGPCAIHRMTFAPCRKAAAAAPQNASSIQSCLALSPAPHTSTRKKRTSA